MQSTGAIVLGILQGLTEFLPVSSSGHLILAENFFGFRGGLSFDAFIHLGTLGAVLLYFWRDWLSLLKGVREPGPGRRLWGLLLVGTLPGAFAGVLLENAASHYFRSASLVAGMLILMSLPMILGEVLGRKTKGFMDLGLRGAFLIGLAQALALIPGTSRSGITISAALLLGLRREEAARFSFLLSAPIIAGAGLLEGIRAWVGGFPPVLMFWGWFTAFISGILAIHFLLRFLRTHTLYPFVVYRVLLGALIFLLASPALAAPPLTRVVTLFTAQGPAERIFEDHPRGVTTGLLLPGGRYVLAAYPEVKEAVFIEALLPGGESLSARLAAYDPFTELAFLQLSRQVPEVERLHFLSSWPGAGTRIFLVSAVGGRGVYPGWVLRAPALRRVKGFLRADLMEVFLTRKVSGPLFLRDGTFCGFYVQSAQTYGRALAEASWVIKQAFRRFRDQGRVEWAWLGVEAVPVSRALAQTLGLSPPTGLILTRIYPDSPAARAGLRVGKTPLAVGNQLYPRGSDIIVQAGGISLSSPADLLDLVLSRPPGSTLRLKIWRKGHFRYIRIKLARRPLE